MYRSAMACLLNDAGDWRLFLRQCKAAGANMIRIFLDWLDGEGTKPNAFHLFLQIGEWNPYALGGYGGYPNVPIFDLTKKDEAAWAHLREVLQYMKELGLTPWFIFQDRCSISAEGWQRFLNSFFSNKQRYPGWDIPGYYTPETGVEAAISGSLIGEGLNDYYWQYEYWVIDLCYQLGITFVAGEPMNEVGDSRKDQQGNYIVSVDEWMQWLGWRMASLSNLKYNVRIISIREPLSYQLVAPICDIVDAHWIVEAGDIDRYAAGLDLKKAILNSDGGANGKGPLVSEYGQHNRSLDQARSVGAACSDRMAAGFCELFPEQITHAAWNTDRIDYAPLRELSIASGGLADLNAEKSKQHQKSDEAKIEQAEQSCYEKYIAHRPISKWQLGAFLRCIFSK